MAARSKRIRRDQSCRRCASDARIAGRWCNTYCVCQHREHLDICEFQGWRRGKRALSRTRHDWSLLPQQVSRRACCVRTCAAGRACNRVQPNTSDWSWRQEANSSHTLGGGVLSRKSSRVFGLSFQLDRCARCRRWIGSRDASWSPWYSIFDWRA